MSTNAVCDFSILDKVSLFKGLAPDQLSKLNGLLHKKTYPAGTQIMGMEQMGEILYIIVNGAVRVHIEQENGTCVIISILGEADIVGEMSLLDNVCRCASVVTIEETTLLWMDRAPFKECLLTMPTLTYNLACILSGRLRLANEQIETLAVREVESRIARQILAFAERYGKATSNGDILIPIRLTQSDIASLVGATRESVNKVLVSYKARKFISADQNYHITIHNQKALASRCK